MKLATALSATFAIALTFAEFSDAEQVYCLGFPPEEGTFNVIDGKPYLLRKGERGSPGNAVDVKRDGTLIHFLSKKPLVYPLDGENPVVSLGKSDAVSGVWDVAEIPEGRRWGVLRSTEGKFKGWYLDWSENEAEMVVAGKTFHVRELVLVKQRKVAHTFTKYPVSK